MKLAAPGDPTLGLELGETSSGPFLRATPEEREHLANVLRLRIAVAYGAAIWLAFIGLDWLMCQHYGASFWATLSVRLGAAPLQWLFIYRLARDPPPGPGTLFAFDLVAFAGGSAALATLGSLLGGIAGPYTPGVFIVLICRNAFLVQPWRRSVLPNALIVLAHFAALGVHELLDPGSILRLAPAASWSLVLLHFVSLSCGAVLLTAAANTAWALRRRVFEARNLGRYRLESRIGEGGHGEVWRAYHPGLRQEVAIKVLRSEISEDARALARFEREIDALCRLRHPHTIRILDYGATRDGVCYYAMELLEGVTLAGLVRSAGPLEPGRAVYLGLQVSQALAEAHRHGIVHRDVKPENVFVQSSETIADFVKLLDFGVAKRHEVKAAPDPRVTGAGMVVGTPAFMAPEVAVGEEADPRADVYGVGALLHFMVTGHPPAIAAVPQLPASLPTDLRHVIERCLARSPEGRYPDAGALAAALGAVKDAYAWRPQPAPLAAMPPLEAPATHTGPRRNES